MLFALLMVPAYIVGSPDRPTPTSSAAEVASYFGTAPGSFVLGNGVVTVFSTFFFLWFLGALRGLLRRAEGGEGGFFSSAALAGGTLFITLSCAGYAAETVYPAAVLRFENFNGDAQLAFASLVLSTWLYHFCQVGASVMIAATSLVALGTGVLPRWAALVGLVVAVLTLLHLLLPLPAALAGLLWVALVSALILVGSGTTHPPRRPAR